MTNDDRKGEDPGGPLDEEPGADAWVDQWITLFNDADETIEGDMDAIDFGVGFDSGIEPGVEFEPGERLPTGAQDGSGPGPEWGAADDGSAPGAEWGAAEPTEPRQAAEPASRPEAEPASADGERPQPDDDVATIEAWQRSQERSRRQARVRANQRAARQMRQLAPDHQPVQATLAPASVDPPGGLADPVRRLGWVAGGLVAVILGLIGYLFLGSEAEPAARRDPVSTDGPAGPNTPELGLTVGAGVAPASIQDLARSTVQVVGLDDELNAQCAGSGVIVSTDGTILTNAHVVRSDAECQFTSLGIGVTVDSSSPPELLYRAEVVLLRLGVDLAVLRVAGPLTDDEGIPWPRSFPAAPIGDSDTVELGDSIRILGYPVIGGDTITLTTGSVSGFTSQVGLGNRALIKTDATISAGNSGGLAIDGDGRVVGIPTKARASERGPAVDCRPVSDTNGDGLINGDDACVSVGGFVNGIRPINLSLPLLAAAGISDPVDAPDTGPAPEPLDLTTVELSNPRFALGQTDDNLPEGEIVTAVAGLPELCFFVDWEGIPPGALWDGAWYVDNVLQVGRTAYTGRLWEEEESGLHFSLCIEAEEGEGLSPGVYEIALYLDRQVAFVEGIELTEAPVETVATTWQNKTGRELCGLAVNPAAISRQVGLDELPDGTVIEPDGEWVTQLPIGSFVVEAYGCNGEPVANRLNGLEIERPAAFQIES